MHHEEHFIKSWSRSISVEGGRMRRSHEMARAGSVRELPWLGMVAGRCLGTGVPFLPPPGSVMQKRECQELQDIWLSPLPSLGPEKSPLKGRKWSGQGLLALSHTTSRSCSQCSTVSGLATRGRGQCASSDRSAFILVFHHVLLLDHPLPRLTPMVCSP